VGGVLFQLQLGQDFLKDALGYDILANALAEHRERKEGRVRLQIISMEQRKRVLTVAVIIIDVVVRINV
jgi:hypothetical protein